MINRWDLERIDYEDFAMRLSVSGDYVLFEDYEEALGNLEYDLKALQRKYDLLVDKIGDVYREA